MQRLGNFSKISLLRSDISHSSPIQKHIIFLLLQSSEKDSYHIDEELWLKIEIA